MNPQPYDPTLWWNLTPLFTFAIWGASMGIYRDIKRIKHKRILKKYMEKQNENKNRKM